MEITDCCQEGLREREREGARGEKRRERIMGGGRKSVCCASYIEYRDCDIRCP